jgi:hypothetical protein
LKKGELILTLKLKRYTGYIAEEGGMENGREDLNYNADFDF